MKLKDVPADLLDLAWDAWVRQSPEDESGAIRATLAAVLPAHERQVREHVAAAIEAQKTGCAEHPMPLPRPSCWTCARDGALHRAARIARGEP